MRRFAGSVLVVPVQTCLQTRADGFSGFCPLPNKYPVSWLGCSGGRNGWRGRSSPDRESGTEVGVTPAAITEVADHRLLDRVLERGRVRSVYQPIIDLASGQVAAYEAL